MCVVFSRGLFPLNQWLFSSSDGVPRYPVSRAVEKVSEAVFVLLRACSSCSLKSFSSLSLLWTLIVCWEPDWNHRLRTDSSRYSASAPSHWEETTRLCLRLFFCVLQPERAAPLPSVNSCVRMATTVWLWEDLSSQT